MNNPQDLVERLRSWIVPIFPGLSQDLQQAAARIEALEASNAALVKERDEAMNYLRGLLVSYVNEHCDLVPEWAPLEDILGMLIQMDIASTVTRDIRARAETAEARAAALVKERESLIETKREQLSALDAKIAALTAEVERMRVEREAENEACAKVAEGELYHERYRTWPWWKFPDGCGNKSNESEIVRHCDAIAAAIRARAALPTPALVQP